MVFPVRNNFDALFRFLRKIWTRKVEKIAEVEAKDEP